MGENMTGWARRLKAVQVAFLDLRNIAALENPHLGVETKRHRARNHASRGVVVPGNVRRQSALAATLLSTQLIKSS